MRCMYAYTMLSYRILDFVLELEFIIFNQFIYIAWAGELYNSTIIIIKVHDKLEFKIDFMSSHACITAKSGLF